jgi:PH (Pleckstrin Homology) domain-containing protein
MGLLNSILGNASEINTSNAQNELSSVLMPGEIVLRGFKIFRDMFVFTGSRLIMVNRQGLTGSKVSYYTIPYRSITHFCVETAGTFDADAELKIWISSQPEPVSKQLGRDADVIGLQKTLAQCILGKIDPVAAPLAPLPTVSLSPEIKTAVQAVKPNDNISWSELDSLGSYVGR